MISLVTIILLLNTIVSFVVDQSIFYSMSVHELRIPMVAEKEILTKAFIEDLESFTVQDDTTGFLRPVICSVCDSNSFGTEMELFSQRNWNEAAAQ